MTKLYKFNGYMKKFLSVLFVLCILISLTLAQKDPPLFVQPATNYQRASGIWGSWISAQQNIITPPEHFVCGVAYRQMIWKKNISCGCPTGCTYCLNTLYSMVNGIKITFCHYRSWNKQIEKTFQSGTNNSGSYKEYKCPRDTYVSRATSKFGFDLQTDLGMNGIQLVCESLGLNGTASTIQDPSKGWVAPMQKSKHGSFVSSILIKSEVGGKFTGINFGFAGVPIISKITFQYSDMFNISIFVPYERSEIENTGTMPIQKLKQFNQQILVENFYNNENLYTHEYEISKDAVIEQYEYFGGILIPDGKRELVASNFSFGDSMQTRKEVKQNVCIQASSCKKVEIVTQIGLKKAKASYTVVLTFINRLTEQLIGVSSKIKGVWSGTLVDSVKTKTTQTTIEGCEQTPNLTSQQ